MSQLAFQNEPRYAGLLGNPAGNLALRILGPQRRGQVVQIAAAKCTIGSDRFCTLRLQGANVHPLHCLVLRGERGTVVRRLHADTRLNGQHFDDALLLPGDRLSIGPIELEIVSAPAGLTPTDAEAHPDSERRQIQGECEAQQARERIERIEQREQSLQARQEEIDLRQTEFAARQAEFDERSAELERQRAEFDRLRDDLERQREGLRRRAAELDRQTAQFAERDHRLRERAAAAATAEEACAARRAELETLSAAFESQRAEWEEQTAQLAAKRQALAEREAAAERHQSLLDADLEELAERERELSERERQLADRERAGTESDQTVAQREREIAARENQLAARERQANELLQLSESERLTAAGERGQCEAIRRELDALRQSLDGERERLAAEGRELDGLRLTLETLQGELDARQARQTGERQQFAEERKLLADAQQRLTDERAQFAAAQQQLAAERGQLAAQAEQLAVEHEQFAQTKLAWEGQIDERAQAIADHARHNAAQEELQRTIARQRERLDDADSQLASLQSACASSQAALDAARAEREAAQANAAAIDAELAAARNDLAAAQARLAAAEADLSDARRALSAAREAAENARRESEQNVASERNDASEPKNTVDRGETKQDVAPAAANDDVAYEPVSEAAPVDLNAVLAKYGRDGAADDDGDDIRDSVANDSTGERAAPPAQPMPAPVSHAAMPADDDDSIEDYMAQLLRRVRGQQEESHDKGTNVSPAQRKPKPAAGHAPAAAEKTTPAITPVQLASSNPYKPIAAKYEPRRAAPELATNLLAMRELANSSARTAIGASARDRLGKESAKKIVRSIAALLAGAALLVFAPANVPYGNMLGYVAITLAFLWGYQAAVSSKLYWQSHRDQARRKPNPLSPNDEPTGDGNGGDASAAALRAEPRSSINEVLGIQEAEPAAEEKPAP